MDLSAVADTILAEEVTAEVVLAEGSALRDWVGEAAGRGLVDGGGVVRDKLVRSVAGRVAGARRVAAHADK